MAILLSSCNDYPKLDSKQEKILNDNWNKLYGIPIDSVLYTLNKLGIELEEGESTLIDGKLIELYSIKFRVTNTDSIRTVLYHISEGKVSDIDSKLENDDKFLLFLSKYDLITNQRFISRTLNQVIRIILWVVVLLVGTIIYLIVLDVITNKGKSKKSDTDI